MAGCTAVVKAPDPDPLTLFAMADLITEAGFPPGVINIVAATREASEHLVAHPDVDMVTFTGSTEVGKKIGEVCGAQVKRCVLELGGKSAAIILEDADLDTAVPMVVALGAGTTQGENCTCMSRILAPRAQYDEIVARAIEVFKTFKVGDPHAADTVVGPLVTEAHRNRVLGYIKTAVDEGATVAFGGGIPADLEQGWYVEPTLLTNVSNDSTIAQEEIFGPVIVVIPYDDEEDAVRLANDSKFGLSGAVFTSDPVKGFEIARRIRTGTFRVNTMSADFNSSFGGYKESGIGREHGPYAIDEYLLDKTISIEPGEEVPDEVLHALQVATRRLTARVRPRLPATSVPTEAKPRLGRAASACSGRRPAALSWRCRVPSAAVYSPSALRVGSSATPLRSAALALLPRIRDDAAVSAAALAAAPELRRDHDVLRSLARRRLRLADATARRARDRPGPSCRRAPTARRPRRSPRR